MFALRRNMLQQPRRGACTFAERADRCAQDAFILWQAELDPSVLAVTAEPVDRNCIDRFELGRLQLPARVLITADRQRLSISDGSRRIRLDVAAGTLLEGPVRLRYKLAGFAGVEAKLLTLRRLLALVRLGRFPRGLDPPDPRVTRWIMMLRAHDLSAAGATQREIGSHLFGAARVASDWRGPSDSLRLQVRRLLRFGDAMVGGGYLRLLRGGSRSDPDVGG